VWKAQPDSGTPCRDHIYIFINVYENGYEEIADVTSYGQRKLPDQIKSGTILIL